jgi:hypothetical protein
MAVRSRVEAIDRDIVLALDDLAPEAQSLAFAAAARTALAEAQEINRAALGRVPPHETVVDGRAGAPLESVRPGGTIAFTFVFHELEEVFVWIWAQLAKHAPVRTGRFSTSFVFLADGVEVASPFNVPEAGEYFFSNVQPYTRKIERGLSPQAPNGVFEAVAAMAASRFGKRIGNMATIRFSYRSLLGGPISQWAAGTRLQSHSPSRNRPGAARQDWLTRQPAIIITPRG